MITITIKKAKTGDYIGFHTYGHAGYDKIGKDIICAAVSILTINTVNSIEILVGEQCKIDTNEKEGILIFSFYNLPKQESKLLLDSMVLGLEQIRKQYGNKYLELKFEEV